MKSSSIVRAFWIMGTSLAIWSMASPSALFQIKQPLLRGSPEEALQGAHLRRPEEHSLHLARPRDDLLWWYFTANEGTVG